MDGFELIVTLVINIPITLLFVVLGITYVVRKGKRGEFALAGWNTLTPEQRATINKKTMFTFIGWVFIVAGLMQAGFTVGLVFGNSIMLWAFGVGWLFVLVGGLAYANTNKRFKNSGGEADEK